MRIDKIRLQGTVGHQGMLYAIHLLDLSRARIDPVNQSALLHIGQCLLMLWAQQRPQEDMPVAIVLFPPIEINVERHLNGRFE
jgi:hypothetical protein